MDDSGTSTTFVERWQKFKDADEGKHKLVEVHRLLSRYCCVPKLTGIGAA